MSRVEEMQALIRFYKQETGNREIDMRDVAAFAVSKGWPLPKPLDPLERLAKDFKSAARQETRTDVETGEPYRVHHMYVVRRGDDQLHLWVDIDEARREPMHASLTMRREQSVSDNVQLTLDAEHWNRINPDSEPLVVELDYTLDVAIRRAAPVEPAQP